MHEHPSDSKGHRELHSAASVTAAWRQHVERRHRIARAHRHRTEPPARDPRGFLRSVTA